MSEYVPIEIQEEILKRLPLKPLIIFRSVSKPWKRLIDSPYFMVSYAVRHPQPHRFILRYAFPDFFLDEEQYLFFVDNDDDDDDDDNDNYYDNDDYDDDHNYHGFVQQDIVPTIPDLVKRIGSSSTVVGSSHGLVCFVGDYEYPDNESSDFDDSYEFDEAKMIVLWNPSIGKSVGIPVPEMYDSPDEDYKIDDVIGFGVCPVTFEPTILKIECIDSRQKLKGDMPIISVPWRVRVFTLSTGTWSILSNNLPRQSIGLSQVSQVVIDRFIYWVALDMLLESESKSHFLIMSFDLIAKEFKEINLPDSLTNGLCSIQTISKLRESLVLLEYHREFEEGVQICSLWMMKKKCDNISFTKLYNINVPHATVNTLLGFRKTGELILVTRELYEKNAEVQIYQPNSEAIHYLYICGDGYSFSMCSYRDSLLLVDRLDGFIYSTSH